MGKISPQILRKRVLSPFEEDAKVFGGRELWVLVLRRTAGSVREYPSLSLHGKGHLPFFLRRLVIIRHQLVFPRPNGRAESAKVTESAAGVSAYTPEKHSEAVRLVRNARALCDRLSVRNGELEIGVGSPFSNASAAEAPFGSATRHFVFKAGEREVSGQRAGVIADGEGLRRPGWRRSARRR